MVIDAAGATVTAPELFTEPALRFGTLTARLGWTRQAPGFALQIDDLVMMNDDMAATLAGTYRSTVDSPGIVDFTANIVRAEGPKVYRYIPAIGVRLLASAAISSASGIATISRSRRRLANRLTSP